MSQPALPSWAEVGGTPPRSHALDTWSPPPRDVAPQWPAGMPPRTACWSPTRPVSPPAHWAPGGPPLSPSSIFPGRVCGSPCSEKSPSPHPDFAPSTCHGAWTAAGARYLFAERIQEQMKLHAKHGRCRTSCSPRAPPVGPSSALCASKAPHICIPESLSAAPRRHGPWTTMSSMFRPVEALGGAARKVKVLSERPCARC